MKSACVCDEYPLIEFFSLTNTIAHEKLYNLIDRYRRHRIDHEPAFQILPAVEGKEMVVLTKLLMNIHGLPY